MGLEAFHPAGILDAEVLSCDGASGVVRIHVENEVEEQRLEENDTIEWWDRVTTERPEAVYLFGADVGDSVETADSDSDGLPRTEQIEITENGPCSRVLDHRTRFRRW